MEPFVELADGVVISYLRVQASGDAGNRIQQAVKKFMGVREGAELLDVRLGPALSSGAVPWEILVEVRTRLRPQA